MADALIVRGTVVGRSGTHGSQIFAGLVAGEALEAASPCFIDGGKVYMASKSDPVVAATGMNKYFGFNDRAVKIGEPVTIYGVGSKFQYAAGTLTSGDALWISDTAGSLTTDAPVVTADLGAGTVKVCAELPVAYCIDDSNIIITR